MISKLIYLNIIFTFICGSVCAMITIYEILNKYDPVISLVLMCTFYILMFSHMLFIKGTR